MSAYSPRSCELYKNLLTSEDYDGFLRVLKQRRVQELENETDELLTLFFEIFNSKIKSKVVEVFEECLKYLSNTCNSRNLLIVLTEKISKAEKLQDIVFFQFIDPFFICLDRITYPKTRALSMVLSELYKRIYYLDLPKDLHLENAERKLMIFDKESQTITKWLLALQGRINLFVEQHFGALESSMKHESEVKEVLKLELRLLSRPLAYLDLSADAKSLPTDSHRAAGMIMKCLNSLQPNPVKLITQCLLENERNSISQRNSLKETQTEDAEIFGVHLYPEMGLSVYAYLVYVEGLQASRSPKVYSHLYSFLTNIPFICLMLSDTKSSLQTHKGLQLAAALMRRLSPGLLRHNQLDGRRLNELLKCLSFVASVSKVEDFKRLSLQIIATLVKVHHFEARSKLFVLLLTKFSKPAVIGASIGLLREDVMQCCGRTGSMEVLEVEKLYQLVFHLPNGEKCDLLENSELIVAALNLLYSLVTHDPPSINHTCIWTTLPSIQEHFLHHLGRAVEISRCHYNLERNKVKERRKGVGAGEGMGVGEQQQLYCFKKALKVFDMLNDLLSRATSVIQSQLNKHPPK